MGKEQKHLNIGIITILIMLSLTTGCQQELILLKEQPIIQNNPTIGYDQNSLISFDAFYNNCTYETTNTTNASLLCNGKATINLNWNGTTYIAQCCNPTNECNAQQEPNITKICEYNNNETNNIQSLFWKGQWINMCCNSQGKCYNLNQAQIGQDNKCPANYTLITISPYHNGTGNWDSYCCNYGGLNSI